MTLPIFDIKNAEVYRGRNRVFVNLNLRVIEGEHVAILGPNGSGKTTLLKLLTRELSPVVRDDSHIELFGQTRFNLWDLREKIGVVSNDFQNQYQALATGFNVVLSAFFGSVGIHGHHQPNETQKARARQTLTDFGLQALAEKPYLEMSNGEQRRCLLARAMVHNPKALILDEPTNSLDVSAVIQLLSDIRRLAQGRTTVILVTHHIQEIIPEIDRVVLIDTGQIVSDSSKESSLTGERLSQLFKTPLCVRQENGFYNWFPRV